MMKVRFVFILFLWFNIFYAQQKDVERIIFFLNKSNEKSGIDNLKSLEYAKKASLIAEKINHSEKKSESYLFIAKCLYVLDSFGESLVYIEKGLKEDAVKKDPVLASSFKEVLALDYFATGLEEQGLNEYFDIIDLVKSNRDEESIRILSRTYAEIGAIFLNQEKYGLGHQFLDKAIKANMKVNVKGHINERADLYNIKGYLCLYDNKEDSALHYFQKSYAEIDRDRSITKYVQYTALGDYYYQIKKYRSALDYYQKALSDLKRYNMDKPDHSVDIIKNISEIYGILKNTEKQKEYLLLYQKENEILKKSSRKDYHASVNSILNKKADEISSIHRQNSHVLLLIILFSLIICIFLYVSFRKKNIDKKKALKIIQEELNKKQEMIFQNEIEKQELKLKVNDAFVEVIHLAKNYDPSFLARFKEVYPEFCEKILSIYPDILNSEFVFCAYLKLGFSTKEIAAYTFVSHKAIESRKSRIRKKFGIPSNEDLYIWFDKI